MPQVVPVVVVVDVVPPAGGAFLFAAPDAESANHLPPKKFWRCPSTWPEALSSLKRYSGWPLYVTCDLPFLRFVVPRRLS